MARALCVHSAPPVSPRELRRIKSKAAPRRTIKIGRPGYKVTKQKDPETNQRSLLFQIEYPESEDGLQPRHRFMSAYEQRIEAPDKNYQYLLFACEPYETVGFKIPNREVSVESASYAACSCKLTRLVPTD